MYIDKSFQLIAADSSKAATDEARRQFSGDEQAEFGDLLDAEQEQQKAQDSLLGAEKKAGQEVAALLDKAAKSAGLQQTELTDKGLESDHLVGAILDSDSDVSAVDTTVLALSDADEQLVQIADPKAIPLPGTVAAQKTGDELPVTEVKAEPAADSNPWLSIIHQSKDFKSILSQTKLQTSSTTEQAAETPVTDALLKVASVNSAEQLSAAAADAEKSQKDTSLSSEVLSDVQQAISKMGDAEIPPESDLAVLDEPLALDKAALQLTDVELNRSKTLAAATKATHNEDDPARPIGGQPEKLPAVQTVATDLLAIAATTETPAVQDATVKVEGITQPVADETAKAAAISSSRLAQPQLTTEPLLSPTSQTENLGFKNPATAPIDGEYPVTTQPEEKTQAKKAPQSFAQFQKAANAAAALSSKQQLQNEQSQQPVVSELAIQQPQRVSELNAAIAITQNEAPAALGQLLQSERSLSTGGGAMGSSAGQQQQQTASQLLATRVSETTNSTEPPALNLLEPNAASQLKERVLFQINQKIQSAEIKLAPEELGSMQIKVQLQQEQLSVQFVVQQAGAKDALEQQMPRLREMLEEQGIELTQGQVSQQGEGSDAQRQARERQQAFGRGADRNDEPVSQQAIVRVSDRMVDYYA